MLTPIESAVSFVIIPRFSDWALRSLFELVLYASFVAVLWRFSFAASVAKAQTKSRRCTIHRSVKQVRGDKHQCKPQLLTS
jgi:hypothetical protein